MSQVPKCFISTTEPRRTSAACAFTSLCPSKSKQQESELAQGDRGRKGGKRIAPVLRSQTEPAGGSNTPGKAPASLAGRTIAPQPSPGLHSRFRRALTFFLPWFQPYLQAPSERTFHRLSSPGAWGPLQRGQGGGRLRCSDLPQPARPGTAMSTSPFQPRPLPLGRAGGGRFESEAPPPTRIQAAEGEECEGGAGTPCHPEPHCGAA
ncbi:PREDICTED: uncharacterized protein LOC106146753 [Chinchilla lanigera]|uniref:uncharacterized protein LOC106146753 n=1 Tax=Chinchilla lanigera TaxID=34839 RepID=UPI000696594E|nr:PREDICTED: uncharacterized protein LOC106146753 [Chinchilla lanigera]